MERDLMFDLTSPMQFVDMAVAFVVGLSLAGLPYLSYRFRKAWEDVNPGKDPWLSGLE
jgi:hypothetical protein